MKLPKGIALRGFLGSIILVASVSEAALDKFDKKCKSLSPLPKTPSEYGLLLRDSDVHDRNDREVFDARVYSHECDPKVSGAVVCVSFVGNAASIRDNVYNISGGVIALNEIGEVVSLEPLDINTSKAIPPRLKKQLIEGKENAVPKATGVGATEAERKAKVKPWAMSDWARKLCEKGSCPPITLNRMEVGGDTKDCQNGGKNVSPHFMNYVRHPNKQACFAKFRDWELKEVVKIVNNPLNMEALLATNLTNTPEAIMARRAAANEAAIGSDSPSLTKRKKESEAKLRALETKYTDGEITKADFAKEALPLVLVGGRAGDDFVGLLNDASTDLLSDDLLDQRAYEKQQIPQFTTGRVGTITMFATVKDFVTRELGCSPEHKVSQADFEKHAKERREFNREREEHYLRKFQEHQKSGTEPEKKERDR